MKSEALLNTALPRSHFWAGVLGCVLFAIAAVLLRGIRWDESYEHGQILAGLIPYPADHPLAIYVHNAFSLQTYLSAALLKLGAGPLVLCGLRNILFLLASLLPIYVLVSLLSRSVLAGLLSTLLLLQGILLSFDGSYPTMVWPEIYSNGHIGGGVVLLALCALLALKLRLAFLLLGLIPAIHIGQWPPYLGTVCVYVLHLVYVRIKRGRRDTSDLPRLLPLLGMTALGLACTLTFYLIQQQFTVPLPPDASVASDSDSTAIWQGYTTLFDPHRQYPPGNGQVILLGTLLLSGLASRFGRDATLRRHGAWLAIYTGGIGAAVWITMLLHAWYGAEMPFLLIAWMPYRLINHLPPIGLALMAALILSRWPLRGWWILGGATLTALCLPLFPRLFGEEMTQRYLADGSWIAFGLFGAALLSIVPTRRIARQRANHLKRFALISLAFYHHFGAVCVLLGFIVTYILTRRANREPIVVHPILFVPVILLIVGSFSTLRHQFEHRETLPTPAFEQAVAARHFPAATTLLLAPPDAMLLQAQCRLPVLTDVSTPSLISYLPALGPEIDRLYRDIYGRGFSIVEADTPAPSWEHVWQARSTASWRALGETYGFTHVIAPTACALNLHAVLAEEDYGLYAVTD